MNNIKTSDIGGIMSMLDKNRSNMSVCFLGPPGIGKTQGIYDWARENDRNVVTIIASQCLPSEVAGFVMPGSDGEHSVIYDPQRLVDLKDGDILFFDELLTAPTPVLSACLTLIQERTLMSGRKLADVIVVAAANPLGAATQIPLPVRQRFMFMKVGWNRGEWNKWMRGKYGIDVPKLILDKIATEGNDYNVLTPRSATKIIDMVSKVRDDTEKESAKIIIDAAFGDTMLTDECLKICDQILKPSAEDLVIKHVLELNLDDEREVNLIKLLSTSDVSQFMDILEKYLCDTEMKQFEEAVSRYDRNDFK